MSGSFIVMQAVCLQLTCDLVFFDSIDEAAEIVRSQICRLEGFIVFCELAE